MLWIACCHNGREASGGLLNPSAKIEALILTPSTLLAAYLKALMVGAATAGTARETCAMWLSLAFGSQMVAQLAVTNAMASLQIPIQAASVATDA